MTFSAEVEQDDIWLSGFFLLCLEKVLFFPTFYICVIFFVVVVSDFTILNGPKPGTEVQPGSLSGKGLLGLIGVHGLEKLHSGSSDRAAGH